MSCYRYQKSYAVMRSTRNFDGIFVGGYTGRRDHTFIAVCSGAYARCVTILFRGGRIKNVIIIFLFSALRKRCFIYVLNTDETFIISWTPVSVQGLVLGAQDIKKNLHISRRFRRVGRNKICIYMCIQYYKYAVRAASDGRKERERACA